jgi:hypothetical protein
MLDKLSFLLASIAYRYFMSGCPGREGSFATIASLLFIEEVGGSIPLSSAARDDAVGGLLSCQILGMQMPSPDDMRARTGRAGRGTQRHQRRAGAGAISGVPRRYRGSP